MMGRRRKKIAIRWVKEARPNIVSRAFRMLFVVGAIFILLLGSSVRIEYNPERAKAETKTWMDHLKKVVSTVKTIKPLF